MINNGEKTIADKGYTDNRYFINPRNNPNTARKKKDYVSS
jgi:hypothetical protein